jgi:hypothetical protein
MQRDNLGFPRLKGAPIQTILQPLLALSFVGGSEKSCPLVGSFRYTCFKAMHFWPRLHDASAMAPPDPSSPFTAAVRYPKLCHAQAGTALV